MSSRPSASGVNPSSPELWHRYVRACPRPGSRAARVGAAPRDRLGAHAVLGRRLRAASAAEVGAHPAAGEPVAVVGVEQQAADAVLELAADPALLLRRVPARQRRRHRVVGRGQRDLVERAVAQLRRAVARRHRLRGRLGAAAGAEGADAPPRSAPPRRRHREAARARRLAGAGVSGTPAPPRPVDHAQDDLEPLVEHVDADERDRDLQRGQRPRDQQQARRRPGWPRARAAARYPCGSVVAIRHAARSGPSIVDRARSATPPPRRRPRPPPRAPSRSARRSPRYASHTAAAAPSHEQRARHR